MGLIGKPGPDAGSPGSSAQTTGKYFFLFRIPSAVVDYATICLHLCDAIHRLSHVHIHVCRIFFDPINPSLWLSSFGKASATVDLILSLLT